MAYDASDFGQNDPTESAAAVGNAMGGNFSASDFGPTNQDLDPLGVKVHKMSLLMMLLQQIVDFRLGVVVL